MFGWVNRATLPLLLRSSAHPASVQIVPRCRFASGSHTEDRRDGRRDGDGHGDETNMAAAAGRDGGLSRWRRDYVLTLGSRGVQRV